MLAAYMQYPGSWWSECQFLSGVAFGGSRRIFSRTAATDAMFQRVHRRHAYAGARQIIVCGLIGYSLHGMGTNEQHHPLRSPALRLPFEHSFGQ